MLRNKPVLLVALAGLFMLSATVLPVLFMRNIADITEQAGKKLSDKLAECSLLASQLLEARITDAEAEETFRRRNIGLYLLKNDSLIYWNNSRIALKKLPDDIHKKDGLIKLADGYYLSATKTDAHRTALALCLVRSAWPLQNNYLKNEFRRWTGIPAELGIKVPADSVGAVTVAGAPLFSVQGVEEHYYDPRMDNACLFLFWCGFIVMLVALLLYMRINNNPRTILLISLALILFRLCMIGFRWPGFLYRTVLYDVRLFGNADSWINGYLGDLLLNVLVYVFVIIALRFYSKTRATETARLTIFVTALVIIAGAIQFNNILKSLVTNSTINFDFLNVFNLTLPACAGIFSLALYALGIFLDGQQLLASTREQTGLQRLLFPLAFLLSVLCVFVIGSRGALEVGWPLLSGLSIFIVSRIRILGQPLMLAVQLLVMSAITAGILSAHIERNREKDIEVLSVRLAERQDPILENEFAGIPGKVAADHSVANLIGILPESADALQELLLQKYFGEYFRRFNIELNLFDRNCLPLMDVKQPLLLSEGYLEDQIRYHSDSTMIPGLWFVSRHKQTSRYIGRISIGEKRLYVLMEPKQLGELGSFPDLLLDQSQQRHEKLKNLSYAVYRSGQLNLSYGAFSYPQTTPDSSALSIAGDGHVHYYFQPDDFTTVITTRPERTAGYFFTFNSYLLLLFSLVVYAGYFLYSVIFTGRLRTASLSRRIQAVIILLLLLAMSAVGYISARLVKQQFEEDNKKQLAEKSGIIVAELGSVFKPRALFDAAHSEAVKQKLNEYARLFNTDISLFGPKGLLHITSQPRLYGLGLAAPLANPGALRSLHANATSAVTASEKAGMLNYLSLYSPVYSRPGEIAGFVNLPYFARQDDLVNELSGIISGLVNVYVILFVLSIVAGLILSGYITQPLRMVQEQISRIGIGKKNEKIDWNSNDEIGRLVAEYNHMLEKLEESALLLARSERESAWREMAKQVAHEIKNPLTPMKLSLQHLQQLARSDGDAFREKFGKASVGIIEQIDSLANIANEFSHFAKLPVTQVQEVNLIELINSSADTFAGEERIRIRNLIPENELLVKGDREQCLRVFNNIFANAVQALQDTQSPSIEIGRRLQDHSVTIIIRDNGPGIDEELKERIFSPSFTTKSTGSGLGLAIVKSIMESLGGRVWFESEKGLGTAFYLDFELA
jgi:two-component system, NtrC family, nitrogen regulation sensor histidine kinase NtrY